MWFVASRPFLLAARLWNREKLSIISGWTADSTQLNAALAEGGNSSELQVMVPTLTAVGSMLFPLIKVLFRSGGAALQVALQLSAKP